MRSSFKISVFRQQSDITVVCSSNVFILELFLSLSLFFQYVCRKKGLKVSYICHVLFMNVKSPTVIFS